MLRKIGFSTHPVLWANLILVLISYTAIVAYALWGGRRIMLEDVMSFWPLHLMLALNLFGIFGPAEKRR